MSRAASVPIHVGHVLLSLRPGGLENGVVNVINGLDRREFLSSVCCLQSSGEFAGRITDERCRILEFGLQPGNDPRLVWRLARAFRNLRLDIVHTRNAEAFFYGALAAKLARVPALVHSEHGRVFPEKWHRALLQRWLLRSASCAFAVSRQLADQLVIQLGVPPGTFRVIYNGVETRKFAAREPSKRHDPNGEVVIGSVGRLVAVKNYRLLLQAVVRLPQGMRWRLVLIGEGPERDELERTAEQLGVGARVSFLGHREDVAELLGDLDLFVLPSISEGMSNTLLEAMAAGVAVIASDVGGNREIIESGRSGLLFAPGDPQAAAQAIQQLAADAQLRGRLASAGLQRATTTFGLRAMLSAYEDLYRSVRRTTSDQLTKPIGA
jgi:sugar transferase (PEP-CTERM/EpsH1 system associated)